MLKEGTIIEPGQELARFYGYTEGYYRIVKVKRVTPTGMIVLEDGNTYYSDGRERSSSSHKTQLYLLTPEVRAAIEREKDLAYVKACQWRKVDNDTLREVVALLKKAEE